MKLSIVILAQEWNQQLEQALESALFAKEVLIIWDTDSNHSLPRRLSKQLSQKIEIIKHPLESNFSIQRNFALERARCKWVFFLDSDEIISPKLAEEIKKIIKSNKYQGYYLLRKDIFYGQQLRYGETGQIKILRLAQKQAGKFVRPIHETWQIQGLAGQLHHPLLHYRNNLTAGFIKRMAHYSTIDAEVLDKEGKPFSLFRLLFYPAAKFGLNYFWRWGFLDGSLGLFHAYLMSVQSLTIRVFQKKPII